MSGSADAGTRPGTPRRTHIVTPDAVGLDLEIATLGSRGAAYLLDLVIFGTILLLLGISRSVLGGAGFVPGWFGIAVLLLFAFAWQFGYPIGFEVLAHGRTPGKAALGLRVITVEGAPVGLRHAVIRATVAVLELLGTFGALAVLSSFSSARGQRLGDLAAGTLVVRERRGGATPSAQVFDPPAGYEAYTARLDVSGLGPDDYAAVRETLRRAGQLPESVRDELTSSLASRLVGRVQPPPPAGSTPVAFLACVAAAVQSRTARRPATVALDGAGGTGPTSTGPTSAGASGTGPSGTGAPVPPPSPRTAPRVPGTADPSRTVTRRGGFVPPD